MSGPAIQTATLRGSELVARAFAFELRLNNLLGAIGPDFNHAFIVAFAGSRYAQDLPAGTNRVENHPAGSANTPVTLIIDINF